VIVEQRTYTMSPPKLKAWVDLYEQYGLPLQNKYLGGLIGFFVTEIGTLNQVVHFWKYDSLAERERRRAEMIKDPAWPEFLKRSAELGATISQESKIMVPTSFSPIK
jgi:hypothetical protein